ncbi:MAG: mannose-1-phosphate guanylyltransferase [Ignavibacteriales bacterium CG_4_9_14_3_um_filter_34_10]|nr:MAG: mannose-1-phosphate guanylyltransferase [Ignavibacteriales bacterium CG_4_9_14_3_um_filter_34_10]
MKKLFAVIMAGGVGSRFWPKSREKQPKQLLNIFGQDTMIQSTCSRLNGLIPNENIFVITNQLQQEAISKQLPFIPKQNIIAEPFGKNTAAAIGLSSVIINKIEKNSVILVLPADHLINDVDKFQQTIKNAKEFAEENDGLITFGIIPTRPETGYGYIQADEETNNQKVFKVKTFAEKPNLATAERFIESGDFFWNSGMFIWKSSKILAEISKYMPELFEGLELVSKAIGTKSFNKTLAHVYGQLKSISIDYGVMEKSKNVYLIKGEFDWSDVGSWEEVYLKSEKHENGMVEQGDVFSIKSNGCYISARKFTSVVGANNLIVIDTEDSLLVCNRNNTQDVKLVVDYLKLHKRNELL